MDLFYPRALSRPIQHAWDTVDLFYLPALSLLIRHAWIQWTYSIPGPLVSSYDMPGYSGPILPPDPWSPHTTCLGYSGPILSPDPWSPHTTCLGYSGPILSPRPLVSSYDMPGIQWTYSILRALGLLIRHAWDTVDLYYPRTLGLLIRHACDTVDLFYLQALGLLIRHAWDTEALFYPRAPMEDCIDCCDLSYMHTQKGGALRRGGGSRRYMIMSMSIPCDQIFHGTDAPIS